MPSFEGLDYITPLTVNSRERVFRSETINLRVQAVGNSSQRWDMTITMAPSNGREAAPGGGRLSAHRSYHGLTRSFQMEVPQPVGTTFGGDPDTLFLDGSGVAGAGVVAIDRANLGPAITIPAGTFVTFGAFSKVYQVRTAFTMDSDENQGNLEIFPNLVENITDGSAVNTAPMMNVFYADDGVEGVTYVDGILARATISVVEAL